MAVLIDMSMFKAIVRNKKRIIYATRDTYSFHFEQSIDAGQTGEQTVKWFVIICNNR